MTEIEAEVEAALELMRPVLALGGGTIELVAVEQGVARVRVRLSGPGERAHVAGLFIGIQRTVQSEVAGIRALVDQDLLDAGYPLEHLAARMEQRGGRPTTSDQRRTTNDE